MIRANIAEVKAHFSSYVKKARAGEVVVVCERNVPVAELKALQQAEPRPKKRELGTMRDLNIRYATDAFEPMSDEDADEIYNAPLFVPFDPK